MVLQDNLDKAIQVGKTLIFTYEGNLEYKIIKFL